jgi:hypothetical protein
MKAVCVDCRQMIAGMPCRFVFIDMILLINCMATLLIQYSVSIAYSVWVEFEFWYCFTPTDTEAYY